MHAPFPKTIQAELAFDDTATAQGIVARGSSPALLLARKLIEAGYPPGARLEAYRGSTLCLTVRSIGEAATLQTGGDGVGFRYVGQPGARPVVRRNGGGLP
jgi:hypothetical protein